MGGSGIQFWVEIYDEGLDKWFPQLSTQSRSRDFCYGFVSALNTVYPSPRTRVMRMGPSGEAAVIHVERGRGSVGVARHADTPDREPSSPAGDDGG